jgi:molybdate transport system ATP-binding protein
MLDADIQLRLGTFSLDAELSVAAGEIVALLGPNGAGKSTAFNALAGLLPLAGGRITLDGVDLDAPGRGIRVPVEKRPISVVFQDYLLFPHLTAADNVAYGLRTRGVDRDTARARATDLLGRLDLAGYEHTRPGSLSGGQQQRVALARALAPQPKLLLLDESMAALDVSTKVEIRRYLRTTLRASSSANVMITHDLLDAVALADRVVVIEHGTVVQTGSPREVIARPRSAYVADLAGLNFLTGRCDGRTVALDGGGSLTVDAAPAGDVVVAIDPSAVTVHRTEPERSASNVWLGRIGAVDLLRDRVRVRIDGTPQVMGEAEPGALDTLHLDDGGDIWASVAPTDITVYTR